MAQFRIEENQNFIRAIDILLKINKKKELIVTSIKLPERGAYEQYGKTAKAEIKKIRKFVDEENDYLRILIDSNDKFQKDCIEFNSSNVPDVRKILSKYSRRITKEESDSFFKIINSIEKDANKDLKFIEEHCNKMRQEIDKIRRNMNDQIKDIEIRLNKAFGAWVRDKVNIEGEFSKPIQKILKELENKINSEKKTLKNAAKEFNSRAKYDDQQHKLRRNLRTLYEIILDRAA